MAPLSYYDNVSLTFSVANKYQGITAILCYIKIWSNKFATTVG